MKKSFVNYSFDELLVDLDSLSSTLVIYDIPTKIVADGKIVSIPYSLTERQAGEVFQKIASNQALMESLVTGLDEAERVPAPTNITGAHPVDERVYKIEAIVRSMLPDAPIFLTRWFSSLAYKMAISIRSRRKS